MPSTGERALVSHQSRISSSDWKKANVGNDINDIIADMRKVLIFDIFLDVNYPFDSLGCARSALATKFTLVGGWEASLPYLAYLVEKE